MKHIMQVIPNRMDGTSFYRATGPLSMVRTKHYLFDNDDFEWESLMRSHLMFMQRPFREGHVKVARMANDHNLPLWCDWDDLLDVIKPPHPNHKLYGKNCKAEYKELIERSDVITTSTPTLARHLEKRGGKDVRVVENTLPPRLWDQYQYATPYKTNKTIFWRGGGSHMEDWREYVDALADTDKGKYTVTAMGEVPRFVQEKIPDTELLDGIDIIQYFKKLRDVAPAIAIYPLQQNDFNACKSDIFFLETALIGGSTVLAPDTEEWRRPGVVNYTGPEDFKGKLQEMVGTEPSKLKEMNAASVDWIKQNRNPRDIFQKRMELIEEYGLNK